MIESCFVQLIHLLIHRKGIFKPITPVFLADYLYSSRLYIHIYVVDVGSIVEAIEAHPQDSFSLPSVCNTKNGGLKKRLGEDRNIYVCLSRNVFGARGPRIPL